MIHFDLPEACALNHVSQETSAQNQCQHINGKISQRITAKNSETDQTIVHIVDGA